MNFVHCYNFVNHLKVLGCCCYKESSYLHCYVEKLGLTQRCPGFRGRLGN